MYELIQVSERSYYIQSPAKIGLVRLDGQDVCLIDSGNDKDAGRKVRQLLDANGWRLTAIYNTHSNADHIGGNKYLQGQTGCKIYAPGIDCAFTRHPVLEPSFLYGGYPCIDVAESPLAVALTTVEVAGQNATMSTNIISVWAAGALICALVFGVTYWKCRQEFQTSFPVENAFIRSWLNKHQQKRPSIYFLSCSGTGPGLWSNHGICNLRKCTAG